MRKEYRIERNPWAGNGWNIAQEESWLNEMSERGWDLVCVGVTSSHDPVGMTDHVYDYYFSREIAINTKLREIQLKEGQTDDQSEPRSAAGGVPEEGV